jgi:CHAT domain-containing protein
VTLEALQTDVLREGELFIDTFLGSDVSFVFAVSRDAFRVVRLPSDDELKHRLLLYRALLSSAPGVDPTRDETEALERTGSAVGAWILGGLEDLLVSHRRVIISPDGPLNLVPANQLLAAEPERAEEVVVVPSASVLARLRESVVSRTSRSSRILALVGEWRSDGTPLPGARKETGWLTRRFKGAERHRGPGFDLGAVAGGYDILHVAAHTTVYDQRPWHSGIHLGEGPADQLDIRASEIVGQRVPAQLVVLAGCESAGGRTVSGEGVLGLSSAFLSAGATCVIATLWPVDDRATSRLMQAFYEALANGEDVAGALGSAKLHLRESARWRHPFYWAGVVIIGDGGSRMPLERRAPLPAAVLVSVALMLATVGALAVSRRGRKRPAAGGKKLS